MIALAELLQISRETLMLGFAVFLRVGAAMALLPAFGERTVPMRVRGVLALAFTLITAPAVASMMPVLDPDFYLGTFLFAEVVIGLTLGALLRLFVLALQIAGSIAAQSVSLAQILGGAALDPQPAIGHIMVISGLALAVMLGLHVKIVQLFVLSYDLLPAGQFPAPSDLLEWGIERVARAFALGFSLAAPFVITSLVYNLALGVINRAMPQLMVSFVGAPAITAGGLILLMLALPFILQIWVSAMDGFLIDPVGAPR
ncbi:flagellar biosynthetic protein FliR [Palleronia aestuarii]|uniref:Flagellar biosynthetic protein FliR n=1 Tax=Palleronia aestuarii TaxID=568105 RepID=A0A2W7N4S8_9RHOB|nr:flagellar biosynthetic protein FliR [Palleronia aestuarii]PZX15081.1 flagellar biosynthetic protein FliR [Palleronia aestuarii]